MLNKLFNKLFTLSIGKRNMTGFFSIILLLSLISIASLGSITLLSYNTQLLYEKPYTINQHVWTIRNSLNRLEKEMYKVVATNSSGAILQTTADCLSAIQKLRQLLPNDSHALGQLDTLSSDVTHLGAIGGDILQASLDGDQNGALTILTTKYLPTLQDADDYSSQLATLSDQTARNFLDNSTLVRNIVILTIILLTVGSIFAAFYISLLITRSITTPLKDLEEVLTEFAKGNLTVNINFDQPDEIGALGRCALSSMETLKIYIEAISESLATLAAGHMTVSSSTHYMGDFSPIEHSITHIATSLNQALYDIYHSTSIISAHSLLVHEDAESLAQKASDQALITSQLFASIQEVATQVDQNAASAQKVHDMSDETAQLVTLGKDKIHLMTEAIEAINVASQSIEKIIGTIDGIAYQSNLLALNASIEAARLGDAGKGFGVIASEMQFLSMRSSTAVKETTELIQNSLSVTQEGAHTVVATAQTLSKIVEHIYHSQSTISTIAATSKDQAIALQNVVTGIKQIKDTTHTVSSFATHSAEIAQDLSAGAQELKANLAQFTLY